VTVWHVPGQPLPLKADYTPQEIREPIIVSAKPSCILRRVLVNPAMRQKARMAEQTNERRPAFRASGCD
jgi:hypothetical protein